MGLRIFYKVISSFRVSGRCKLVLTLLPYGSTRPTPFIRFSILAYVVGRLQGVRTGRSPTSTQRTIRVLMTSLLPFLPLRPQTLERISSSSLICVLLSSVVGRSIILVPRMPLSVVSFRTTTSVVLGTTVLRSTFPVFVGWGVFLQKLSLISLLGIFQATLLDGREVLSFSLMFVFRKGQITEPL